MTTPHPFTDLYHSGLVQNSGAEKMAEVEIVRTTSIPMTQTLHGIT
jgi:hypothetical protein